MDEKLVSAGIIIIVILFVIVAFVVGGLAIASSTGALVLVKKDSVVSLASQKMTVPFGIYYLYYPANTTGPVKWSANDGMNSGVLIKGESQAFFGTL